MFFFAGKLRQFEHLDFNILGSTFDHISAGYTRNRLLKSSAAQQALRVRQSTDSPVLAALFMI